MAHQIPQQPQQIPNLGQQIDINALKPEDQAKIQAILAGYSMNQMHIQQQVPQTMAAPVQQVPIRHPSENERPPSTMINDIQQVPQAPFINQSQFNGNPPVTVAMNGQFQPMINMGVPNQNIAMLNPVPQFQQFVSGPPGQGGMVPNFQINQNFPMNGMQPINSQVKHAINQTQLKNVARLAADQVLQQHRPAPMVHGQINGNFQPIGMPHQQNVSIYEYISEMHLNIMKNKIMFFVLKNIRNNNVLYFFIL